MNYTDDTLHITAAAYGYGGNRFARRQIARALTAAEDGATHITGPDGERMEIVHTEDRMREIQAEREARYA